MSKCKLNDIDIEYAKKVISNSTSVKEILNKLGYSLSKSTHVCKTTKDIFNKFCKDNNIDISHLNNRKINNKFICKICGKKISRSSSSGLCYIC